MYVNFDELNFDATDADTLKKYLDATKAVSARASANNAEMELPEQYRGLCKSVKTCYDDIFGAGVGEKICGKKDSLKICTNAFRELVEEYKRQMQEQNKANAALITALEAAQEKSDKTNADMNVQRKVVDID